MNPFDMFIFVKLTVMGKCHIGHLAKPRIPHAIFLYMKIYGDTPWVLNTQ